MYPIKLNPVFKEIVWGGERLKNGYGYESDLNNIAYAENSEKCTKMVIKRKG